MKTKTITVINKLIIAILIGCFPILSFAEAVDPSTVDASGPDFTLAKNSLLNMLTKQCSIVDWGVPTNTNPSGITLPASGRSPSDSDILHSFDRPKDFAGTYVLQDLVEQLSSRAVLQEASPQGVAGPPIFHDVTDKMKFADQTVIFEALRLGYLRNMKPKIFRNNKDLDVPAASTTYILPTSCGTFVFSKYQPRCITTDARKVIPKSEFSYQVMQYDDTDSTVPPRTFKDAYFMSDFYSPSWSSTRIAEQIYDKYWSVQYTEIANVLQGAQTGLELIPFGSSVSSVVKIIYAKLGWLPPITVADGLGMSGDVVLDAIPYISQLKKARQYSKQIFIIGSGAVLGLQVARSGLNQNWELQDTLRMIVLAITGFQLRANAVDWNSVTNKFEESPKISQDLFDGFTKIGVVNRSSTAGAVGRATAAPAFNAAARQFAANMLERFSLPTNIPVSQHLDVLVDKLKIAGTAIEAAFRYRFGLIKQINQKLASYDVTNANNLIQTLETHLGQAVMGQTKKNIFEKTIHLEQDDWSLILKAQDHALTTMRNQTAIAQNTPQWRTALYNHFLSALEGDIPAVTTGSFTHRMNSRLYAQHRIEHVYDAETATINYSKFDGNMPTHYTIDTASNKTFYFSGDTIPPSAAVVDFSLTGISGGNTSEVLNLAFLKIKAEELTHAATHYHDITILERTINGVNYILTGIGLKSLKFGNGSNRYTAFIVPQSVHTPTVSHWLENLDINEIKTKLTAHGYDISGLRDTDVRQLVSEVSELDVYFLARETGGFLDGRFKNEYATRILAQEAEALGIITIP